MPEEAAAKMSRSGFPLPGHRAAGFGGDVGPGVVVSQQTRPRPGTGGVAGTVSSATTVATEETSFVNGPGGSRARKAAQALGSVVPAAGLATVVILVRWIGNAGPEGDALPRSVGGLPILVAGALGVSLLLMALLYGVGRLADRRHPAARHRRDDADDR